MNKNKVYILAYFNLNSIRGSIEQILYSEKAAFKTYEAYYKVFTKTVGGFGEYDKLYLFETTMDFVDTYDLDCQVGRAPNHDIGAFIQRGDRLGELKILKDNCLYV